LHFTNPSFEQYHPNYQDLKTALSAYYALNDVMLGETVGDPEITTEKERLTGILKQFSEENKITVNHKALAESLNNLQKGNVASLTNARVAFVVQLGKILSPPHA